jgi:MFS family permease
MTTGAFPRRRGRAAAERRSGARAGYTPVLIVWAGWLVVMASANLATPLYAVYAEGFGFSTLVLTAVFATYAVVLVPALVVFGRLSDRYGRRLVILAGLGVSGTALIVFALARGTAWLFAARGLQGLAVGMISGAATAALVELDPHGDRRRAAMFAGLAQAGGSAAGPIAAGMLAQWAPAPLRLSFVLGAVATVVAGAATLRLREDEGQAPEPWRIQRPRVPAEARSAFFRVGITAGTVWATLALYLSIVPSYAKEILATHDLALLAAIAATAVVASFLTQVVAQRRRPAPRTSQAAGLAVLVLGLMGLALASPLHSLAVLVAGGLVAGVGHGIAYLSAQEELNELAPERERGEVTAAFIACIYAIVAAAAIAAGLLDVWLSLAGSVAIVSGALITLGLSLVAWLLAARWTTGR